MPKRLQALFRLIPVLYRGEYARPKIEPDSSRDGDPYNDVNF